MPESRKEEKDGCNRHAAGRETLPRQNQYKQRTHAEKTASEEENLFCPKRNRARCFAFCGFVSHILAGAYGNQTHGGNKHGSRSYPSSDYRGAFYRAVCGTALKNRLINAVDALVMSLVLGLTTAYIISRKRFRFGMKKPLTY